MSSLRIEFQESAVHLPALGLWLDAHEPIKAPARVFVSHAHSDHVAAHEEVILSAPTAKLTRERFEVAPREHVLEFGTRRSFDNDGVGFEITLLPAGHIFGSAMALLEVEEKSLLYTGDFKLRRGLSAEECQPRPAEILIMETTFGRPQYVFPPREAVLNGILRFCREALDNDETPVLLGYSLGKSQELLCSLGDAKLPLMLHGSIFALTRIYEQFGQCFPQYERYDSASARGKVLLCPPQVAGSAMLRNLGKHRSAILTGWAVDPNCTFRYQCDAAFALSDHADFPELVELVKRVQPKKVYTLHGFAADFAQTLRDLGYEAQALSQDEQFALALGATGASSGKKAKFGKNANGRGGPGVGGPNGTADTDNQETGPGQIAGRQFYDFAQTCEAIAGNSSKLEKVRLLAEYMRRLRPEALELAATWYSGRPFPSRQNKVLQLGWAVLRDAMCAAGEIEEQGLREIYLKHSDVGETALELLKTREVRPSLSLEEVDKLFQKLHASRGPLAKTPLLIGALERCSPIEAKYLVKIITGDLRIGLKEGLVEDAVASAFGKSGEDVRQANLLLGDIGETAKFAAQNRLAEASLVPFRPIKFMLASPEETATAVWERVRGAERESPAGEKSVDEPVSAVWLEDKYDGIRCQLHKVGQRVGLYSRDLKEITSTFLELADSVRNLPADFVLDGEIVAMTGDEVLPFAELQKRLGRRQGDLFMRDEVPIKLVAFDLLWLGGQSFLQRPLRERRQGLEALALPPSHIRLAQITEARTVLEIEAAFDASRARGNEGLMIKNPASAYMPGRRGLAWLKLKKAFATLDCVVVGAEYGHGKRNTVLSDYTFAVRDEQTNELKTIGKAYTGLTDLEIAQLTEHFLQKAMRRHGRYLEVEPDTVLEIAFDRIQASNRHESGLAMRFPRIVRIRTDKAVSEIDTLGTARKLVNSKAGPSP